MKKSPFNPDVPSNYRPVSGLSFLCKTIERDVKSCKDIEGARLALKWCTDYLSGRFQSVVDGDALSASFFTLTMTSLRDQFLGLLFLIYTSPVSFVISSHPYVAEQQYSDNLYLRV